MPRSERLRRVRDIENILRRSRRAVHPSLMVRARPNELPSPRSTVVVSNAVSKDAVVRNRVKRQIRHQLRQLLKQVKTSATSFDIMVTVKKPLLQIPPADRLIILEGLLERVGINTKHNHDTLTHR